MERKKFEDIYDRLLFTMVVLPWAMLICVFLIKFIQLIILLYEKDIKRKFHHKMKEFKTKEAKSYEEKLRNNTVVANENKDNEEIWTVSPAHALTST